MLLYHSSSFIPPRYEGNIPLSSNGNLRDDSFQDLGDISLFLPLGHKKAMTNESIVARTMFLASQEKGLHTPRSVCIAAGLKPDFLRDIRSGRTKSPRAANLAKLATFLGVSSDWLMHGTDPSPRYDEQGKTPLSSAPSSQITIRGEVQAGLWIDCPEWPPEKQMLCPIPPGNPWPTAFGLRVGESGVADVFHVGSILICVPFSDIPQPVEDGMWVIVRRHMPSPDRYEVTVRRLRRDNKERRCLTLPSCDYPLPPIPWPEPGTNHTKVTAIVIAAYQALVPSLPFLASSESLGSSQEG